MVEKRARFLVGCQQSHHVRPKLWIAGAGAIQIRLARGWLLQQGFVEHRQQAPMSIGVPTHWPGSSQADPPRSTEAIQAFARAGFVDEVTVVPPISRALSGSTTYKPSGVGAQNSKLTFSYDSQHRQTELLYQFADSRTIKTVYSASDASGRPTALTNAGQAFKYTYDDANRVLTIAGPGGLQTHTFDANGNLIREVVAPPGGKQTTQTTTITKTAQVCR